MTMKNLMSWALGVVVLLAAAAGHAAPNLTGTWVLDRDQSEFPQREGTEGKGRHGGQRESHGHGDAKLTVSQDGNTLKVTRSLARKGKERTFTQTYTIDGTEQTSTAHRGTVVTKAVYDGDRLLVDTTHTQTTAEGERQMSRASVWTVSPDGQTLTIETTMQSPRGERQMKMVYQKS